MQLGMIGTWPHAPTWCGGFSRVATSAWSYDMSPTAVQELTREKAGGPSSLADFVKEAGESEGRVADGAAAVVDQFHRRPPALLEKGDILIDGRQLLLHRRQSGARRSCGRKGSTTSDVGPAAASWGLEQRY